MKPCLVAYMSLLILFKICLFKFVLVNVAQCFLDSTLVPGELTESHICGSLISLGLETTVKRHFI